MFDWLKGMFSNLLDVPTNGQWSLEWQPPTSGWVILAIVGSLGLFAYVWFIYRMEGKASTGKKVTCAILRCLALLLLLWWILPKPVLRVEPPPGQKDAYVLVLMDRSQSMQMADHYQPVMVRGDGGTLKSRDLAKDLAKLLEIKTTTPRKTMAEHKRIDLINKVFASKKLKILERFGERYRVVWTTFAEKLDDEPLRRALAASAPLSTATPTTNAAGDSDIIGEIKRRLALAKTTLDALKAQGVEADLDKAARDAVDLQNKRNPGGSVDLDLAVREATKMLEDQKTAFQPIEANGNETDIARAIRQAIKLFRGKTIAAIVIVTDGRSTSGEDVATAAQYAKNQSEPVPIFTVGVGDPSPPRNIRVATPQTNEYALMGDTIAIDYEVHVKGFRGRRIEVELEATRADGYREQIAPKGHLITEDTQKIKGTFQFSPAEKGEYTLTVRVPVLDEEINPRDNARATGVKVRDEKIKILLIAGGPNWEYRNLKNLFVRDSNVLVSCWLQSADKDWYQEGDTGWTLTRLPRSEQVLFKYDVVLLVDPTLISTVGGVRGLDLDKTWFELLKKFVQEHGGGVAFIAGRKFSGETLTRKIASDLLDILPIQPDNNAIARDMQWPDARTVSWPMSVTPEGQASAVLRLSAEEERNKTIWRALPGPHWCFPVSQEKLGAQVLMRHGDPREQGSDRKPRVLMATQFAGAGRTYFCGTDATWQWNRVGPRHYGRFWNSVVRFLVRGRLLGGRKYAVAQSDKDEYNLGDTVKIWTVLRLPNDQKPTADVLKVTVKETAAGGGQNKYHIKLKAEKQKPGSTEPTRYLGNFYPSREGTYEFTFDGSSELPPDRAVGKKVEVKLPEIEFLVPQMDEALLRRVASESGGSVVLRKFLRLADIKDLPDRIPDVDLSEMKDPIRCTLWDKWPLGFLPFVLLLIGEWVLRKFWRML